MPLSCLKPQILVISVGSHLLHDGRSSFNIWYPYKIHSHKRRCFKHCGLFFINLTKLCFGGFFELCSLTNCFLRESNTILVWKEMSLKLMVHICYSFQYISLRIVMLPSKYSRPIDILSRSSFSYGGCIFKRIVGGSYVWTRTLAFCI